MEKIFILSYNIGEKREQFIQKCFGVDLIDIDLYYLDKSKSYENYEQCILIIHIGGGIEDKNVEWVRSKWLNLRTTLEENNCKNNIIWLIVKGGDGYLSASIKNEKKIHFLRYPLEGQTMVSNDIQICFEKFLKELKKNERFDDPPWNELYPPQNDKLVILHFILSAPLDTCIESLRNVGLEPGCANRAYEQYSAITGLRGKDRVLTEADFKKLIDQGMEYGRLTDLSSELKRILGGVLD